ncbi:MAG: FecR family protein [Hyphomicrobiaceae bacterium]
MQLLRTAMMAGLAALVALAAATPESNAGEVAGKVTRMKGEASAKRGSTVVALAEGAAVEVADEISTGGDARLELTLADDTRLTLGANASLVLDTYVYDPEGGNGSVVLDAVAGAMRFTTGKVGKMNDKKIEVRTTFATLAVRGTDFFAGPVDKTNGVLLLEGLVEVRTAKGAVVLDTPRNGTTVASSDKRPSKARPWSDARIARAIGSVSF